MSPVGTLGNALEELGLPQDPREVVGHPLVFGAVDEHIICGVITSIGYGPEEGVSFRISSPQFHGRDIKRIVPHTIRIASLHAEERWTIEGEFEIL